VLLINTKSRKQKADASSLQKTVNLKFDRQQDASSYKHGRAFERLSSVSCIKTKIQRNDVQLTSIQPIHLYEKSKTDTMDKLKIDFGTCNEFLYSSNKDKVFFYNLVVGLNSQIHTNRADSENWVLFQFKTA
jgi:hypothetical protein